MTTQTFEVTDFQADVLGKSRTMPVLVDFWAPWCGPCRVLGPTLEKLAQEAAGQWQLVKINTDQHPELSRQYGIRGIPAVKLFVDGEVVDEFTGALPDYAVRQWLEKALPSENKKRVAQAQTALDAGEPDIARSLLEQVVEEEPGNAQACMLLARLLAFEDPARAETLIDGAAFAGAEAMQTAEAIRTLTHLLKAQARPDALSDAPVRPTFTAALDALAHRDFDAALEQFIEVIQQDRYYHDDAARKACIALFNLLGEDDPVTRKHRRTFDMSLY